MIEKIFFCEILTKNMTQYIILELLVEFVSFKLFRRIEYSKKYLIYFVGWLGLDTDWY